MNNLNFNQIYAKYYYPVYNRIYTRIRNVEISQEITNDVFVKVNEHLKVFDPEKSKLITWIFNITDRKIIDNYRSNSIASKQVDLCDIDIVENISYSEYETDSNIDRSETAKEIHRAISKLKGNLKPVAELFFLSDQSHQYIAETLDMPLGTVKGLIFRVREKLQKELQQYSVC